VRPSGINNGGDPTGIVVNVRWQSWGGPQAAAEGTSTYVAPNETVAQGKQALATVVAFYLGMWNGKFMYQAINWYFPEHGQTFNPKTYINICMGTYVGQS
jgi:hypothetical protein